MATTDPMTDVRPMVAPPRRRALPEPAEAPAAPCDLPPDFESWFRNYREPVYRYVRFRVATRDIAEDITSEVFMKALRSLSQYDRKRSAPQTWLLRIARNAVTDHLRAMRRHGSLHVSLDHVPDLVSGAMLQEERLIREERLQRVLTGLGALREADQEILSLRYGAGLENKEIAGSLGIRPNAVAVRIHRALERLKAQVLTDPPPEEGNPMTRQQGQDGNVACPPGIEALDRELREIVIEERSSFGPELRAELVVENRRLNLVGGRRAPRFRQPRWLAAAAVLVLMAGVLAVPPLRASLARLFTSRAEPVQLEVTPAGARPAGENPAESGRAGGTATLATDTSLRPATLPALVDPEGARRAVAEEYPELLQSAGIGGTVKVLVWVDPAGQTDNPEVGGSSGVVQLDEAALRATRSLRFVPATRGGEAVGTWVEFSIEFRPDGTGDQPDPQSQALRIPLNN